MIEISSYNKLLEVEREGASLPDEVAPSLTYIY